MNKLLAKLTLLWYDYCPKHLIKKGVFGCVECRNEWRKEYSKKLDAQVLAKRKKISKALAALGGNVTNV